ncbi:MAG TPA: dihydrofolate reductase [Candidatus Paceibacterota bacterium]|nr:dihydrofolate reductase [Candidatus Paceibacterota bacterium]
MSDPKISAIAAIGTNNRALCEGKNLLWEIPADLQRLKVLTMGHTLVMGRVTYESIGHPLRGRVNIIVTKNPSYTPTIPEKFKDEMVITVYSPAEALETGREIEAKKENGEVFIFGGAQIYEQTIDSANKLYLTIIDSDREGTAHFPAYEEKFTKTIKVEDHQDNDKNTGELVRFRWIDLEREK